MTYDRVVVGGLIVAPDRTFRGSIGIRDGRIAAISPDRLQGEEVLDARDRVILPGAVDLHVHFNEPGRTHWEGWGPGSRAAAVGGVTTVVEMPLNAIPPTVTAAALEDKVQAAQAASVVDFGLWGGLITDNLDRLASLASGGVVGFKAFMCPSGTAEFTHVEDGILYEGLSRIQELGLFLAVHAESHWITQYHTERLQKQGRHDRPAWAQSRPPIAELEAIQRALFLAARVGCRLHIVHMSVHDGTTLIAESKAAGQSVTVETCAHYLALTDDDLLRLGPVAKCAPPLRHRAEQDRLWRDVLAGQIDCVTSDHSPCPTDDKTRGDEDIWQAWGGITGVQTLLPVMLTEGIHRRSMPWPMFATLLSAMPAKIAGLWPRKGAIQIGADADLLIVDLEREWTVDRSWLQSQHKHSPFIGRTMKGWVEQVIRHGQSIAENGEVTVNGGGAWLRPHSGARTPLR